MGGSAMTVLKKTVLIFILLTGVLSALAAYDRREMEFGGQIWRIKASQEPAAPGPNYWSDSPDHVWVDNQGLHLTISKADDGRYFATEVFTRRRLGYGTYTFVVDSDIASYCPNIVAGFFTWDTHPDEANREIDIEFASWGIPGGAKGHYVVQPITSSDRLHIFDPRLQGTYTTHRIVWTPYQLDFFSYHGYVDPDSSRASANLMEKWSFSGTPPTEGNARFRINLWLFLGEEPAAEYTGMIIRDFKFVKYQP